MNTSNIQSGLTTAKDGVMTLIKFIVNSVAVPILSAVILGFLVFQITGEISAHREGQDYGRALPGYPVPDRAAELRAA